MSVVHLASAVIVVGVEDDMAGLSKSDKPSDAVV